MVTVSGSILQLRGDESSARLNAVGAGFAGDGVGKPSTALMIGSSGTSLPRRLSGGRVPADDQPSKPASQSLQQFTWDTSIDIAHDRDAKANIDRRFEAGDLDGLLVTFPSRFGI